MADETRRIPIIVREKVAKLVNPDELPLVCGNNDYVVEFDFDDAWANYPAKTALFVFGSDSVPVVFNGNVCKGVAVKNATECAIGVFAGDIRTTTGAYMPCVLSITDIGKTPKAPSQDVYNQIMELLQKAIQGGGADLSDYYNKKEINAKLSEINSQIESNMGSIDANYLSIRALEEEVFGVDEILASVAEGGAF
jgi:hypothetical protein